MGFFSSLLGNKQNKNSVSKSEEIEVKYSENSASNKNFLIDGLSINNKLNTIHNLKENEVYLGLVVDTKSKEFSIGYRAYTTRDSDHRDYFVHFGITYNVIGVLNLNLKDKTTRLVKKEMFDDTTMSIPSILKCKVVGHLVSCPRNVTPSYAKDRDVLFNREESESIASYLDSHRKKNIESIINSQTVPMDSQRRTHLQVADYECFKLIKCIASGFGDTAKFMGKVINSHLFSEDGKYLASTHTPCTVYNFNECFTITVNAKTLDVNVENIGFTKNTRRNFLALVSNKEYDSIFNTDLGMGQVGKFLFSSDANGVYMRGNCAYVANVSSGAIVIPDGCQVVFIKNLDTVTSIKFPSSVNVLDIPRGNRFTKLQEVYLHENMSAKFMGSFLACLIISRANRSLSTPDIFKSGNTIDMLIRAGRYEDVWEYCNEPSRSKVMAWVLNGIRIITYS